MIRLSLRLRLAIAGAVTIALAIGLATFGLTVLFAAHVERQAVAALSMQLDQVIAGLDASPAGTLALATLPTDPRFSRPYGGLYWQVSTEDTTLRSRSLWDAAMALPLDELQDGTEHVHDIPGPEGQILLATERSVTLPERLGGGVARVGVAMDRAGLSTARAAFLRDLAPYAALLAAVLIVASLVQIAVGLRPLRAIGARVAAVRSGDTDRLGADFPAEVRPLASEVDALLEAREAEVVRARSRAGDLAHGLKTPLQALLGEAGRLRADGRDEVADSIEEIAGRMRAHVDRELARARVAVQGRDARADVAEVVAGVVRVLARTGEGGRLDWREPVPPGITVAADPSDLYETLGAITENAARHARKTVQIEAERDGADVVIRVIDDGPGIAPDRIEALMQRGAREDTRGNGLGLTIAADIAEALGGSLALSAAEAGGLEARLTLPAARRS